ncbi:MAG: GNAT family N-acetyltransferase [Cyclobacteriaceae bacterium]
MSKEKPIHIRLMTSADLAQLHYTFLEAFSDYNIEMHLDRKAFERRMLDKLSIDWSLSVGAFSGDKMVGFIAHTANDYQSERYAYNGGTGVIPEYRGLNLTEHMYGLAIKYMRESLINKCVLEVLDSNSNAINTYEKVGFKKARFLKCYKLSNTFVLADRSECKVKFLNTDALKELPDSIVPSFMDSWDQLIRNSTNEKMILLREDNKSVNGYCVFQPENGRIARIWVREEHRRRGLGKSLLSMVANHCAKKSLTVINVDENDQAAHQFLIACGFENQINQWEMILEIA